jgi:hypothetical protein
MDLAKEKEKRDARMQAKKDRIKNEAGQGIVPDQTEVTK